MRDKDMKKDKTKERHGEVRLSWVTSAHPVRDNTLTLLYLISFYLIRLTVVYYQLTTSTICGINII